MYHYLYKLGHQPKISVLELKQFIHLEGTITASSIGKFSQSNEFCSITSLGGTIARLKVLSTLDEASKSYIDFLCETVEKFKSQSSVSKVGVFSTATIKKPLAINKLKQLGLKKINILDEGVFPTIGHIKSALTWFGILSTTSGVHCVVIEEYSDQDNWKYLDQSLPHNDMKRGIMNLKLSKILHNLTKDTAIWDPFCGQGRTMIGGLDTKAKLWGSDKDSSVLSEAKNNIEKAQSILIKKKPNTPIADIRFFGYDVTEKNETIQSMLFETPVSIVTEGYLGPGLSKEPDKELYTKLFREIGQLWSVFLKNLSQTNVKDIVFCIPAYKVNGRFVTNTVLIDSLETLIPSHSRYSYYQDIYARKDAIVGHQILILRPKDTN